MLYNEAGQIVMAYHLYRCWVSEYQALPELDASDELVASLVQKLSENPRLASMLVGDDLVRSFAAAIASWDALPMPEGSSRVTKPSSVRLKFDASVCRSAWKIATS